MAFSTMFHFVDPDLIFLRGLPVSPLSSMPFFKASRPRISAASIALWVVSPTNSNSNSIMAVIFIGAGPIPAWCLPPYDAHPRDYPRLGYYRQAAPQLGDVGR